MYNIYIDVVRSLKALELRVGIGTLSVFNYGLIVHVFESSGVSKLNTLFCYH
jgi:hypothetical protein